MTGVAIARSVGIRAPASPRGPLALVVAIAAAWVAMLAMTLPALIATPTGTGMRAMPGMAMGDAHVAGHSLVQVDGAGGVLAMWVVMVVAMMLPTALPVIRHVTSASLRRRRGRALTIFSAAYLGIWCVAGVLLTGAQTFVPSPGRGWALAIAVAVAVAWQLTPAKRAALEDCHRPGRLPLTGRAADLGVARFATANASACVRSCWALMLVTMVADVAQPVWMVAAAAVALLEKRAERPRRAARIGAMAIGLVAMLSAVVGVVA